MIHQNKTELLFLQLQTSKENAEKVNILNRLGWELAIEANFSESKEYLFLAEQLAQKLDLRMGLADSLSYLGRVYEFEGDFARSLEYQFKAIKIREDINDKKGISYSLHYVGDIYLTQGDLSGNINERIEYTNKA